MRFKFDNENDDDNNDEDDNDEHGNDAEVVGGELEEEIEKVLCTIEFVSIRIDAANSFKTQSCTSVMGRQAGVTLANNGAKNEAKEPVDTALI